MAWASRLLDPALVERLNALSLSARGVVEGSAVGRHTGPVKGASIDFRQHRIYVRGDEPRRLDWRVLARTDRHYIKEYDQETNLRGVVLLDRSGSMAYGRAQGRKFDHAAKLAAALAYLMLAGDESVGLGLAGNGLESWIAPKAGGDQLARVVEALERAEPAGASDLGGAMRALAERLGRRSVVMVASDFFAPVEDLAAGLARLRHDRHEVILMRVIDRDEIEFPFRRWSRFRGLEGEASRLVEPAIARRAYLDNFARHAEGLRETGARLGVAMHEMPTDAALVDAITTFLDRRRVR